MQFKTGSVEINTVLIIDIKYLAFTKNYVKNSAYSNLFTANTKIYELPIIESVL